MEVHVITASHPDAPHESVENGAVLHRGGPPFHLKEDFLQWVLALNASMESRARALLEHWRLTDLDTPLLVHAHDWLAYLAGRALKHLYRIPLIATIHATEHGRYGGLFSDLSRTIYQMEWELTYEAWCVIVCSQFMLDEVHRLFAVPLDKLNVIPTGVRADKFQFEFGEAERAAFRRRYAELEERIVFFVGRMVPEKGVSVLL